MKPITHKFVAVLNKKIPAGRALNALGHMTAGLAANYPDLEIMRFDNYFDQDGGTHPNISDNPFIVLKADNSNKIRTLRNQLIEQNIPFTDFTDTMIESTFAEQHERTRETKEEDLEYYGICMFGGIETLNMLTKKFSLWRD